MQPTETFEAFRHTVEAALEAALPVLAPAPRELGLADFNAAMHHAVKAGGKRVRPILTLLCAQACKANAQQMEEARHAAVAIELLHSYTLVHDDLPCMDNDTERRGAPTVWAQYGEGMAVLVGDFLQALAFEQLTQCRHSATMLQALGRAATQVIRGQVADIAAAQVPPATWDADLLNYVFTNKTAMLICAACELGAIAADASPAHREALVAYGLNVGIAFQLVDDLLDAQQSQVGNELNALAIYGGNPEPVRTLATETTHRALAALETIPGETAPLAAFAQSLLERLQ